jgi:hypothetical protein
MISGMVLEKLLTEIVLPAEFGGKFRECHFHSMNKVGRFILC